MLAKLPVALALALTLSASLTPPAQAATPDTLGLATWNLEWLTTPEAERSLRSACQRGQPRSDERALPCAQGKRDTPQRQRDDFDALARTAQAMLDEGVDVVALQEVDGPAAARQVFRTGWKVDCFTPRAHPQKVGFAIREGLSYRCNEALRALDIDGATRSGADITVLPGTPRSVRLLAVHLKSGCFDGRLDRRHGPCEKLRQQVPVLERWLDDRLREGQSRVAILGDFNRNLDKDARFPAGDDEDSPLNLFAALSDGQPRQAVLRLATEDQRYRRCDRQDRHKTYIDDILFTDELARQARHIDFLRFPYESGQEGFQLSDHCPVGVRLKF